MQTPRGHSDHNRPPRATAPLVASAIVAAATSALAAQPDFGPNVLVIEPGSPTAQAQIDAIFAQQEKAQFGPGRHAILLKPGRHALNIPVGFYTQVAGLGLHPDDTQIDGVLESRAAWMRNRNATCNFWRCVENLAIAPARADEPITWAVSQASALRRVHVKGSVNLWDGGWSSGGFLADSVIDGTINSGSQQQWFSRNADWGRWQGGNWNMVFVGTSSPPQGHWPDHPYTVIDRTPLVREKPFLVLDNDRYFVMVPDLATDRAGVSWQGGPASGDRIPIDRFHIARPDRDSAATINAALDAGQHLLFTPGIYSIDAPLRVTRPQTVVLGLGYPTLVAAAGNVVLSLADVDGLKVGGLLIEARDEVSPTLVEVGQPGSRNNHSKDPTFLHDLFCRAGGAANGRCRAFVTIHSSHVVGDNLWLWRADHGAGAEWDSNRNENGLIVHGDDVTMYGLFVEHCHEYQTLWLGERGRVYFYQSEMPYDPPSQDAWMNGPVRGYASYKVADHVKEHDAAGLGVYCVFWDAPIIADRAIEAPDAPGVRLRNMIAVRLNGKPNSGINRVLNDQGSPVITTKISRLLSNR
ncbi:MAG: hypothetical protein AMXMBFR58_35600 [Phycisphaerae bacterium]